MTSITTLEFPKKNNENSNNAGAADAGSGAMVTNDAMLRALPHGISEGALRDEGRPEGSAHSRAS